MNKKAKRNKHTAGFLKKNYPRPRQWQVDQDYSRRLSPDNADYLSRFLREYYGADIRKADPNRLHITDELRKKAYVEGNAARRDLLNIADCGRAVDRVGKAIWKLEQTNQFTDPADYERDLVDSLDAKRKLERMGKLLGKSAEELLNDFWSED